MHRLLTFIKSATRPEPPPNQKTILEFVNPLEPAKPLRPNHATLLAFVKSIKIKSLINRLAPSKRARHLPR